MKVAGVVVVLSLLACGVFSQLYYMNGQGRPAVDPYAAHAATSYMQAYGQLAGQLADPVGYVARNGHPLVHYVHPGALAALHQAAMANPYYYHQYASYANPASAWYQSQYTARLPHIAGLDVAPVVSDNGDAAEDAARKITEALRTSSLREAVRQGEDDPQGEEEDEHPHFSEVETTDIPRCFICDRTEESCRLECKAEDSFSSGYTGYKFDAPKFVGDAWFQEKTGLTSIPKVTPETDRQFCTVQIGGKGSYHSIFMKAFHAEFCLMARMIKRPDFLTKFNSVLQHAFRRGVDVACHDSRYAELCLPPRLEETACPGTCDQCEAVVTSSLNAATGGDAFDCAAFHRVMTKELTALGLERHKRSIDAAAYRTKQLYSVAGGLTGRSDRDKLVITENVCAAFGRPSCGCTREQVDAEGAGESISPDSDTPASGAGTFIVGENEHVTVDAVKSVIVSASTDGEPPSESLASEAQTQQTKVESLKQKEAELKAEIAHEVNEERELSAAASATAHEEQAAVNAATVAQEVGQKESNGSSASGSDDSIAQDEEKLKKAEEKLEKIEH